METPVTPIPEELEGIQVPEFGAHQRAGPYRGVYGRGGPTEEPIALMATFSELAEEPSAPHVA